MNKNTLVQSLLMSSIFGAAALALEGTDKPPAAQVRSVVNEYYGTKVARARTAQDPVIHFDELSPSRKSRLQA